MTIKKLKELIADLPDEMRIYADDAHSMFGDDASEFVLLLTSPQFPDRAVFQTKSDIDVEETLNCIAEDTGDDFVEEAAELGFIKKDMDFNELMWATVYRYCVEPDVSCEDMYKFPCVALLIPKRKFAKWREKVGMTLEYFENESVTADFDTLYEFIKDDVVLAVYSE